MFICRTASLPFKNMVFSLLLACGSLLAQGSANVPLLNHIDDYPLAGYSDCWGYTAPDGREYALLGVQSGTSILDITAAPAFVPEIAFIPNAVSLWKDLKTYDHYAYVVNETGGGMQIIDLSDLPNSASLAATFTGFTTSHNIFIDTPNGILYAEGGGGGAVKVYSLADPLNPVQIASFAPRCHDMMVQGNMFILSEGNENAFSFWDVADPANPVFLERLFPPSAGYCHNAWPSPNGNYLITTEETTGNTIKMWDISDLGNITFLDETLGPNGLAHNAFVKGNYVYVSHYKAGLRIYDISDPSVITETGFYDSYPTNDGGGFDGAWGTYPFFPSGKILISDVTFGLYIVYFEGAVEGNLLDPQTPAEASVSSDYTTPNSILLQWDDPVALVNGNPIDPADLSIEIERDGAPLATVAGGTQIYNDTGLSDGQQYSYSLFARIISSDSTSRSVSVQGYAGGAPQPQAPSALSLAATATPGDIMFSWVNPARNIDGSPMDDLAALQLYEDGILLTTFNRSSADSARADSAVVTVSTGTHSYYLTALDNETPANESTASNSAFSPLALPFSDDFENGLIDIFFDNQGAEVNGNAVNPPSGTQALNLNGTAGGDVVALRPVDLSAAAGQGYIVRFFIQPQGNGDAPESTEFLLVECRNAAGNWIPVYQKTGSAVQPFSEVTLNLDNLGAGGSTWFHSDFQFRFHSFSGPAGEVDDWFIDDVYCGPSGLVGIDPGNLQTGFTLGANYPNPFNPVTHIPYRLSQPGRVTLAIYNTLGQRIRQLVDQQQAPGQHLEMWDGRNDAGEQVASGVYLYRLAAEGATTARKLMLLR